MHGRMKAILKKIRVPGPRVRRTVQHPAFKWPTLLNIFRGVILAFVTDLARDQLESGFARLYNFRI
jgi:hypothetical protein